jgi:hypothetical protein
MERKKKSRTKSYHAIRAVSRLLAARKRKNKGKSVKCGSKANSDFDGRHDKNGRLLPHFWGVTVQDLVDLHDEIMDEANPDGLPAYCASHGFFLDKSCPVHVCLSNDCLHDHRGVTHVPSSRVPADAKVLRLEPNMHLVVAREIKPRTREHGCSYSSMKHPDGLKIDAFVTHTWNEAFSNFVGTLQTALEPDDAVWACSFALDQNGDIKEMLRTEDLLMCPFARALSHVNKLVVIVDENLIVPERSWCTFEIALANRWGIPIFLWPSDLSNLGALEDKVQSIDVSKACATDSFDQQRIHRAIQNGGGHDLMNARLRNVLGDRVRFYKSAVERYHDELWLVSREIEEAIAENDFLKVEVLRRQQHDQLTLMQEEVQFQASIAERKHFQDDIEAAQGLARTRILELSSQNQAAHQRINDLERELESLRRSTLQESKLHVHRIVPDQPTMQVCHRRVIVHQRWGLLRRTYMLPKCRNVLQF